MDLPQLVDDAAELIETIGGAQVRFSEITIGQDAQLQEWLTAHVPHPVEALKPRLEGLSADDRQYLLEQARQDARDWPPRVGTAAAAEALLGSPDGQVEALYQGLRVHYPDASREYAARLYRALKKESARSAAAAKRDGRTDDGQAKVQRIFACLFGMSSTEEDRGLPKGPAARDQAASTGTFSSVRPNSG